MKLRLLFWVVFYVWTFVVLWHLANEPFDYKTVSFVLRSTMFIVLGVKVFGLEK